MSLDPLIADLDGLARDLPQIAHRAVTAELERVADDARARWPVDTGRSRAAIEVEGEGISVPVDYARQIHHGAAVRDLLEEPLPEAARRASVQIAEDCTRRLR